MAWLLARADVGAEAWGVIGAAPAAADPTRGRVARSVEKRRVELRVDQSRGAVLVVALRRLQSHDVGLVQLAVVLSEHVAVLLLAVVDVFFHRYGAVFEAG